MTIPHVSNISGKPRLVEQSIQDPAYKAFTITPSNTVDLSSEVRRIWVGVAGHIKVDMSGGGSATFSNVPVGWFDVFATRVYLTGTSATTMIGVPIDT